MAFLGPEYAELGSKSWEKATVRKAGSINPPKRLGARMAHADTPPGSALVASLAPSTSRGCGARDNLSRGYPGQFISDFSKGIPRASRPHQVAHPR